MELSSRHRKTTVVGELAPKPLVMGERPSATVSTDSIAGFQIGRRRRSESSRDVRDGDGAVE